MSSSRQSPGLVKCRTCQGYFTAEHLRSGRHFCLPPNAGYSSVHEEEIAAAQRLRSALGVAYGDAWPSGHLRPEESWFHPVQNAARVTRRRLDAYDSGEVRRHYAGAAGAVVSGQWAEYRTPARAATVASDVFVPLLQASATGFVTGAAAATTYAAVWRFLLAGAWPALSDALAAGAVLGVLAFAYVWLALLSEHRRHLWNVETVETPAPEQPPAPSVDVEAEPPPRRRVKLEVQERNRIEIAELSIPGETLQRVAKMLHNGSANFSMADLSGGTRPLTRSQFAAWRAWLLERNYLAWRDETQRSQGMELTLRGKALMRGLAEG